MDSQELSQRVAQAAIERKAHDVVIVDVRGRCSYTDFLIVCHGTSDRHMQSVAEFIDDTLSREGMQCIGREGLREGQWALIDFGGVIAHVFHEFTREVYDLEGMWRECPVERIFEAPPPQAVNS